MKKLYTNSIFFLIVLSSFAYAYTINTFSDGTSTGNITFTEGMSIYKNISIPYWAIITKAEIDLTGLLIFSDEYCYQESANVSTSCGGLATGTYDVSGNWLVGAEASNTTDGNWASLGRADDDERAYLYINYTKPNKIQTSTSKWQISFWADWEPFVKLNLSINTSCWDYNVDTLVFRVISNTTNTLSASIWQCMNTSSEWVTLFNNDPDGQGAGMRWVGNIIEEAMWWDIGSYPENVTIKTNNEITYQNLSTFNGTVTNIDLNISSLQSCINLISSGYANCTVNFTSAKKGVLQYSDLEVNYGIGFDIYIYDESTNSTIEENLSVLMYNNESEEIYYTNSSILTDLNLPSGEYAVRFHVLNTALGYGDRTYIVTIAQGRYQSLTAYLEQNQSETTFTVYDKGTSELLEGVLATMYRFTGAWVPIEAKYTDITGIVKFSYTSSVRYKFFLSHSNYEDYVFYLDPVQFSSYDIKMVQSVTIDETQDYDRIAIIYAPTKFYANQDNNFTFIIQSPYGELLSYGYDLTYPGGTSSSSGNNVIGSTLFNNFTITGSNNFSTLRLDYYYTTAMAGTRNFTYYYPIITGPGPGTMVKSTDPTYGLGLGTRLFIAVFIVILIVGIASFVGKPIPGLALGLIVFGYFVYTEFIPLWSVLISFAVGVIIIGSKGDG